MTSGSARYRRAGLTSLANIVGRVLAVLTMVITIPFASSHLGSERFGLWMTIGSLALLLTFADFGLGNGLVNVVARAHGTDDRGAIRVAISSAMVTLGLIAAVLLVIAWGGVAWVDWAGMFKLTDPLAREDIRPALYVFSVCFACAVPLGLVGKAQLGLQLGFLNGIAQAAGSLGALVLVLVTVALDGSLPWMVAALLGAPLLAAFVNALVFFGRLHRDLLPRVDHVSRPVIRQLLRIGAMFFLLQLAYVAVSSADNLLISSFVGANAVGDFAIAAKVFGLSTTVLGTAFISLWPAYGEALARGDRRWVRSTLFKSTAVAVALSAVFVLFALLLFDWFTQLWMGRPLGVTRPLLYGLAVWSVMEALGLSLSMLLNGAQEVGLQVWLAGGFSVLCVALKILFLREFGVEGLPWATTAAYVGVTLFPVLAVTARIIRNSPAS